MTDKLAAFSCLTGVPDSPEAVPGRTDGGAQEIRRTQDMQESED